MLTGGARWHADLLQQLAEHLRRPDPDVPAREDARDPPAAGRAQLPHLLSGTPATALRSAHCNRPSNRLPE